MKSWVAAVFAAALCAVTAPASAARAEATPGIVAVPTPSENAHVSDLAAGPHGDLWFTETHVGKIGHLTPAGDLSDVDAGPQDRLPSISVGPDNRVWFVSDRETVGTFSPDGALAQSFPVAADGGELYDVAAGTGRAWVTDYKRSLLIAVDTAGRTTEVPTPTPNAHPRGITVATDGAVWVVESAVNRIGRFDDGHMREYPVFDPGAAAGPIAAGLDGDVWFSSPMSSRLGHVTKTGIVEVFALPRAAGQTGGEMVVDRTGAVHLSLGLGPIGWFDPATQRFGMWERPSRTGIVAGLALAGDELWSADKSNSMLLGAGLAQTKPAATAVVRAERSGAPVVARPSAVVPWMLLAVGAVVVLGAAAGSGMVRRGRARLPVRLSAPRVRWLAAAGVVALVVFPVVAAVTWPEAGAVARAPRPSGPGLFDDRTTHAATLLDPPACHSDTARAGYPCGQVLATGGAVISYRGSNHLLKSAELYDPATDAWRVVAPMARLRAAHTATLLSDGTVLLAAGQTEAPDGNSVVASTAAEIYDPARNEWTPTANELSEARYFHTATLIDGPPCHEPSPPAYCGRVLVAGGSSTPDGRTSIRSAELYDPATRTWTTTGPLGTAREGHTATLLADGRVLVAGGLDAATPLDTAEIYDPASGSWSPTGSMGISRAFHAATYVQGDACKGAQPPPACGKVLATGGLMTGNVEEYWQEGISTSAAELYDAQAGLWRPTGPLSRQREGHQMSLLPGGDVVVTGGDHDGTVDRYSVTAGAWEREGALSTRRYGHTTTVLDGPACRRPAAQPAEPAAGCGRLLVVGGSNIGSDAIRPQDGPYRTSGTTELYQPVPAVGGVAPDHGPIGGATELTLTGDGFLGSFTVRFGDSSIDCPSRACRILGPTRLSLSSPPHDEGPVPVTAARPGGERHPSAADAVVFAYDGH